MKKYLKWAAVFAAFVLGACAGPGEPKRVEFTMGDGQKGVMVVHNQQVPNWMLDSDKLAVNYFIKTKGVSRTQLASIAETERVCRIYAGATHPSNLVAIVSDGTLYGLLGYIGGGLASQAYRGAIHRDYAEYVSTVAAASGIGTGIRSIGSKKFSFENCSQSLMNSFVGSVHILRE